MVHYSLIEGQDNIKKFSDKEYRRVGQGNFEFSKNEVLGIIPKEI